MKELWNLFFAFFRIGAFTFGGGYSMLPMLEREVVHRYQWATEEELLDYFAIAQCTPGVIAVNTATFIGYKLRGITGAVFTTLGVVMPSLIIIVAIAAVLENLSHIDIIQHAFVGIRVAVSALIVSTVIKLVKNNVKDLLSIILCVVAFIIVAVLDWSPVFVVVGASLAGLVSGKCRNKK